jgi:inositol phosphorylceramide mannosyltransferase catalytic subunit
MNAKPTIPRRIIQTGKSRDLPLVNKAAVASLKCLNPDFEYLFFDDEKVNGFIDEEFPQYRSVFDSFRFRIQRYDFFRYLAVYRYGGFYFDLDVFLASGLSGLLNHGCVFSFENLNGSRFLRKEYGMDWAIGNYAFGAAPGHPFLGAVIDNCLRAQRDPKWIEPMLQGTPWLSRADYFVLNTSGPWLLCRTLAENPALAETLTVLFPDDVCDIRNWHNFGDIGIHLMEGSWRSRGGFLGKRISLFLQSLSEQRLIRESRKFGKTRHPVPKARLQPASDGA